MVLYTKTQFNIILIDKEWASNLEECSQKNRRSYIIFLMIIDNHFPLLVDAILLPNNSETILCVIFCDT